MTKTLHCCGFGDVYVNILFNSCPAVLLLSAEVNSRGKHVFFVLVNKTVGHITQVQCLCQQKAIKESEKDVN